MVTRILLAALLAGVLTGIFATVVQSYRVTPLILKAETFENAVVVSDAATDETHSHATETAHSNIDEDGEQSAWAPEDGWERTLYTAGSNILVAIAFSLILVAGVLLTNSHLTLQSGLIWGAGGFVAFVLAPNFGLPPELPGMPAGDLVARQIWWVVTVVSTAAALLVFAFLRHWAWMIAALGVLIAPHIYGAPVPRIHESAVPAALAAEFAIATIVASLLFWLMLGATLGWLFGRIDMDTAAKE